MIAFITGFFIGLILSEFIPRESVSVARHIHKNIYEIVYRVRNETYRLHLSLVRGPNRRVVVRVEDRDTGEDVTRLMLPYLGPNGDAYTNSITFPYRHVNVYTDTALGQKQMISYDL